MSFFVTKARFNYIQVFMSKGGKSLARFTLVFRLVQYQLNYQKYLDIANSSFFAIVDHWV